MTLAAALPYFELRQVGGIQTFGVLLLAAAAAGIALAIYAAHRRGLPDGDVAVIVPVAAVVGFAFAHFFDVAVNQRADAAQDSSLWFHMLRGVSLFGAVIGIAVVTFAFARAKKLDLAKLADAIALGAVSALVIGRIGCALVHDHLGTQTTSPLGIDFPGYYASGWTQYSSYGAGPSTIRLHDLGVYELFVASLLCAAMWLAARRARPGVVAAGGALAYAAIRFGLDFLRVPEVDARYAGLTGAQWGCIAMALVAALALVTIVGRPKLDRPSTRP